MGKRKARKAAQLRPNHVGLRQDIFGILDHMYDLLIQQHPAIKKRLLDAAPCVAWSALMFFESAYFRVAYLALGHLNFFIDGLNTPDCGHDSGSYERIYHGTHGIDSLMGILFDLGVIRDAVRTEAHNTGWYSSTDFQRALQYAGPTMCGQTPCKMVLVFKTKCANVASSGLVTKHSCRRYKLLGVLIVPMYVIPNDGRQCFAPRPACMRYQAHLAQRDER